MAGQEHVFAQNVSPDGTTLVGEDYDVIGFRWRAVTGYASLAPLGIIWASSSDGSVLVGQCANGAFRWTESSGPQSITTIAGGGLAEAARDVSLDGSIRVGSGGCANGQIGVAFRWDEINGAVSLGNTLTGRRKAHWRPTRQVRLSSDRPY